MQYTIKSIDAPNNNVVVSYDIDNLDQTLQAPLSDAQSLQDFLINYGIAYEAGINSQSQVQVVPADVEALVGVKVDVSQSQIDTAIADKQAQIDPQTPVVGKVV